MSYQATILFSLFMFFRTSLVDNNSTKHDDHKLRDPYCCFNDASLFIYDFLDDTTFEFKTEGHIGRTKTKGSYRMDEDTIRLISFSKEQQPDSFYFRTLGPLIRKNDSCLISSTNQVHCKITPQGYCYSQ
jgi:hypothetical protein